MRCFICQEPLESEMVTQRGMPSGMAATARVTEMRIMYSQVGFSRSSGSFVLRMRPTMKTTRQTQIAKTPIHMPRFCRACCRGVWLPETSGRQPPHAPFFLSFPRLRRPAIVPTRVFMPVKRTTALAEPLVTLHPEKAQFSGVSFPLALVLVFFCTSSGSPVNGISLTFKSEASKRRTSAGTMSPTPKRTISPGTIVLLFGSTSFPSRISLAEGEDIFESFSSASLAEFSVTAAMPALRMTIRKMARPST
mmetsp:Transcript_19000/g.42742  ORF Transcript_19000/g.42742 Transcript_19000/m.42742 type:complete len:250 (-) Transcript_19000:435-1184(-)